ncbi:hypothetical protein HAALTHF_31900n [Vreelandella aquamarina]|nr:hypothetical protein HAALTHF_31900n [Halomonas axialensis]
MQGISHKYCTLIQRGDGYGYHFTPFTHLTGGSGTGGGVTQSPCGRRAIPGAKAPGFSRKI